MLVITWSEEATREFEGLGLTSNQVNSFNVRLRRWVDANQAGWRTGTRHRGEIDVGSTYPVAVNVQVEDRTGDRFVVVLSVYWDS